MDAPTIIALIALLISILINIIVVAFMTGKMSATLVFLKSTTKDYQEQTEKHFERLERKQDKHNNLIERMAIVEQSTKSAHHRIDEIKE